MQIQTDTVLEGRITGLKPFGAFVDLGEGVTGLVHISEVSTGYVQNINDLLQIGQTVKVKVLSISPEGKVALSIRQASPQQPADNQKNNYGFAKRQTARVWQPPRQSDTQAPADFEDMLSRFKQRSEEKLSDLNRNTENRRGGGKRRG